MPRRKSNAGGQNEGDKFIPHELPNFQVPENQPAKPAESGQTGQNSQNGQQPRKQRSGEGSSRNRSQKPAGKQQGQNPASQQNSQQPGQSGNTQQGQSQPRGQRGGRNTSRPRNPEQARQDQKKLEPGQNPEHAGRAPFAAKAQNRRRKAGHRKAEVSQAGGLKNLVHVSPQFSPENLRTMGRHANMVTYRTKQKPKTTANSLKVIPLGGLNEIGKNMTVYEYGNDMIIVDVGVAFPEEYQPGIDSVIPDMSYVLQNKSKLRGVFLTHGHEDHIGSISWLLKEMDVPVYGLPLTIELVRYKLVDKGVKGRDKLLHTVHTGPEHAVKAGVFTVEFVRVNHSIADASSLAIHTPAGIAIHSGDFKVDYTPIHGKPIDLGRFAELGKQGVLLFMCESTNIERPGFSPSERIVGETFSSYFAKAEGRIIAATFSSNVSRVQQLITAAEQFNRKVAMVGRSMLNVFRAAQSLGYITIKPDTLIEINEVDRYPDNQIAIITTGSQGEEMSALTRMAYSEHRNIEIQAGDTIIISATPIPGNEKSIYRVINELYKRQANVIYAENADIHVSGHAYRGEIELLHALINPKYFVPGHGEYRHMSIHTEVAAAMGQPWDTMYILNNGDIFECTNDSARIAGYTTAGSVLIDGSPSGTVDSEVLNQRRTLSEDGVVAISIAVDTKRNQLLGSPVIQTRGFIYESDTESLEKECIRRIGSFVQKAENTNKPLKEMLNSNALRDQIQGLLYNKTMRRPVLLLSILEA